MYHLGCSVLNLAESTKSWKELNGSELKALNIGSGKKFAIKDGHILTLLITKNETNISLVAYDLKAQNGWVVVNGTKTRPESRSVNILQITNE